MPWLCLYRVIDPGDSQQTIPKVIHGLSPSSPPCETCAQCQSIKDKHRKRYVHGARQVCTPIES